jgi:hypothetical protein
MSRSAVKNLKERKKHKSFCGPLGAKDQKPTSENKVPPVMYLGLQDGRDREGEREESESEPERTSVLLSGFCFSRQFL